MKMVKSLLLGSAAGLVAVAGAQAADLPVKAKPVEYVKVCSLYGAGFYYIPGTDICMKMGGFVRGQYYYNGGQSVGTGALATSGQQSRFSNDFGMRTRAVWTVDTRSQTEWGTLRTYVLFGYTHDNLTGAISNAGGGSAGVYATRGFIQFAGFTFGKAVSFYDIYSTGAISYLAIAASDTGDSGINLAAYTMQFGNGVSATISAEDPRRVGIANVDGVNVTGFATSGVPTALNTLNNDYVGVRWPDVVANVRVDQAWGSFQVMGAIHDASAAYNYDVNNQLTNLGGNGEDEIGFAVGAGAVINTSFISPGDKFSFQVNYTEGAMRYAIWTPGAYSPMFYGGGNSVGFGLFSDGVYTAAGGMELTKVLGINAAYDHRWTPALKTSVYGGYFDVDYSDAASANLCANLAQAGAIRVAAGNSCDASFSFWQLGSRTQWNIRPDFYMGVDVLYTALDTAFAGAGSVARNGGTAIINNANFEDQDAWTFTFRVHRDIVP
ncbi:putative outer membrane protein [Rhodovulum sp. PH10]|uniref:porin n=1 Tax=Rhodovulum sp. PH10 TaxID=1187851 RepID=UPI00027C27DD|nr:porin [Rhodovulum sp. PH10]EJW11285.1 putative outer membrane protein [Rhodovulum sp. PH10]